MADHSPPSEQAASSGSPQGKGEKRPWWKRLFILGFRVFLGFVGLFVIVFLALQIPVIQNWAAGKVTSYLSERLQTNVELDHLSLEFFDKVVLEGLYIEDLNGDTLLYSQIFKVDLNTGPLALVQRRLSVEEISLMHTRLFLRRGYDDTEQNIQFLIDAFQKPDTLPPAPTLAKDPLDMDVGSLILRDVVFQKIDSAKGQKLHLGIWEGDIDFQYFDLKSQHFEAASVYLGQPDVRVDTYEGNPAFWAQWEAENQPEEEEVATSIPTFDDFGESEPEPEEWVDSGPIFCIDRLVLHAGQFRLDNFRNAPIKLTADDVLDYQHMNVLNIDAIMEGFTFTEGTFRSHIDGISFKEQSGFVCERLSAQEAVVNSTQAALNGLRILTPYSNIGDTLTFSYDKYPDWLDFVNEVEMEGQFNDSRISIEDIITFAPMLEKNEFFRQNRQEVVQLQGNIRGAVNNLRGKDLNVILARNSVIEGDFYSYNLAVPELQSLNLRLDRLVTEMRTLRLIIPGINNLPENYDKLGRLNFSGSFDGFFTDFVAYGDLRSAVGRAVMDMRMDLSQGRNKAQYSGNLDLINFDLEEWTDNSDFGNITFSSRVLDGVGLTGSTVNAKLEAEIDSFTFKKYRYKNLAFEGQLTKNLFDGLLLSMDENIDLSFTGTIDFSGKQPLFDFQANVNTLNMKALNLSDRPLFLSGNVVLGLQDIDLAKMNGQLAVSRFVMREGEEIYRVDSLLATIGGPESYRHLTVGSDLLEAELRGAFVVDQLPDAFAAFFQRNFSTYAQRWNIQPSEGYQQDTTYFDYHLKVFDTQNFLQLVDERIGPVRDLALDGHFDDIQDSLELEFELPSFSFGNILLEDIILVAETEDQKSKLDFGVFRTQLGEKNEFAPINLLGIVSQDTLNFAITAFDFNELLDKMEIDGQLYPGQDDYIVRFQESDLVIWNEQWQIRDRNYLRFGKDFVRTRNFVLTSEGRTINLESYGQKGLNLSLLDFDLETLNEIWVYEPLSFDGQFDVVASVDDVFSLSGIQLTATMDTLLINEDDWGGFRLDVDGKNLKQPFNAYMSITHNDRQLTAEGYYNPPGFEGRGAKRKKAQPNYFDFDINISNYPLAILDYWIGAGVSNTVGNFDGVVDLFGLPEKPNIAGNATIREGATTIDYLNTRYFIEEETIILKNDLFDATGAILRDELGNTARVYGGITHDHLRNLGLNARIASDRFLMLNTKKGQNELFYGKAIGAGDLQFTGSFLKTDIYVNATSQEGTHIVLPVSSERDASEVRFIKFTQPNENLLTSVDDGGAITDPTGVAVNLDINITDQAVVELVFDEQAGDILKGQGNGELQMLVPRSGDFQMWGRYVITTGEYLFTLMNLVNKPFIAREGGTIRWDGDPFAARIDIQAEYKDLKASLTNFISEYLVYLEDDNQNLRSEAYIPTDVDLIMNLTGELMNPQINFDIQFPQLIGQLKSFTDSKLRILRQDQNEMNRQVFGLLILGQFLPANFSLQGQELALGINTLTEMLSQQLSLYLTELVSEWLQEDGLISGIDFDIAYNYVQGTDVVSEDPNQLYRTNEVQVRLKNYLFNDRLSVNVGGDIEMTDGGTYPGVDPDAGVFFAGDLAIEYVLSKDRTLKIRFYQSTEPEIGGGRRNQTGLGLSYRKEFDSFREFLKGLRLVAKRPKKKKGPS
jgi:hypothetical protein